MANVQQFCEKQFHIQKRERTSFNLNAIGKQPVKKTFPLRGNFSFQIHKKWQEKILDRKKDTSSIKENINVTPTNNGS